MIIAVHPISGEDLMALPVKAIVPAIEFYRTILGFSVVSSNYAVAILQRDNARLGMIAKPDHKPGEAGSCVFVVTDLDTMYDELNGRGLDMGEKRIDEWDGKKYRVFFLREAENGYCYCFSQPC